MSGLGATSVIANEIGLRGHSDIYHYQLNHLLAHMAGTVFDTGGH